MTQKWNLQDIRPAEPRKRRRPPHLQTDQRQEPATGEYAPAQRQAPRERDEIPSIVIEDGRKKGNARLILSVVLFFVITGGAIGLSALMGKTELTINPQNREPNVSADFVAYPDRREGELSYEIMTLEATQESQVTASGQVIVEEQATGVIEIIKTTPGTERLIKNTRFRTPSGLIYRIQESVVVPGAVDGVPGTIQAEVFAEAVGEEYNVPTGTTFDIPGFEEGGFTALYEAITARATQPLTGGFSGPQFQIDENELATARQALQVELRNNLLARIENEKPAGTIAFPGSVAISYTELPAVEYGQDLVTVREQALLQIPLFQVQEFGSYIAQETVATYDGSPVRVDDPSALIFSYTSPTTSSSVIANEPSLSFNLTGKPLLIWEYDADSLKENLAGLPKTAINNAVSAYPGIDAATVRITPFWKRTFPADPEEIVIIEEVIPR